MSKAQELLAKIEEGQRVNKRTFETLLKQIETISGKLNQIQSNSLLYNQFANDDERKAQELDRYLMDSLNHLSEAEMSLNALIDTI